MSEDRDAGPVRRLVRHTVPGAARVRFRAALLNSPILFRPFCAIDPKLRDRRVTPQTDLVIEGFPRSANTYARVAFEHANGRGWRVSSHLHSPQSIVTAVRIGLPTILLIRQPDEVLASARHLHSSIRAIDVVTDYVRFYERVLPFVDRVVVADFGEVTEDFGGVLTRCNASFGTSFNPYTPDES